VEFNGEKRGKVVIPGLWGQFSSTIDEKGRLMLPLKLRNKLDGSSLVMTKGAEKCLWLYHPVEWEKVVNQLMGNSSIFNLSSQDVLRRFVAPAEEIEIDKSGRIKLSPSLMKSVSLERQCYVVGMGARIEIWDEGIYDSFEESKAEEVKDTWEGLGGGMNDA